MGSIEKRIVIDDSTERVFQYTGEPQLDSALWPGLLEVRDVHRLIDGVSYMNQIYTLIDRPSDSPNIQLDFETDQSALTTQLHDLDLVMTWRFQPDRLSAPRLVLDGDHTYWSQN
jgi:hypothetical protein